MSEIVEHFEKKARFKDEKEAELIREKLEELVTNILTQVEKRDKRFQSTLIHSGSVYEGVKVRQPDEFDFMIRIDSLTDKPSFHSCDKGEGYAKLVLEEQGWEEFKDEEGFFNPNLLSRYFKKLVNAALSEVELPPELAIAEVNQRLFKQTWWPVFNDLLGHTGDQQNPSGVMYSETHGPATTLYIYWQGGDSYKDLLVNVDLTLTLDYCRSKLPVQLAKLPQEMDAIVQKCGFHVVPAGFDSWRISFSMVEKEILVSSPDGFNVCYRVLKVVRDDISQLLGWDPSLLPSYMFKTVLLSELIRTDRHLWERDLLSERIIQVLKLVLQGVKQVEIRSFFIPGHNLLAVPDHENKLRLCVVEDMLNQMKGLELAYTPEKARERKQQIRVFEMIDLLDYMISGLVAGKNPTAVWNKVFVNIDNVPYTNNTGWFWGEFGDLNTTVLSENAYRKLVRIWSLVEVIFKQILITLEGELNSLAHKLYITTCEKKRKFELEHKGFSEHEVEQISLGQLAFEWIRVFEMIDLLDYMISGLVAGKNPTAVWNKVFVNIGNVPNSRNTGWFWNELTDLNTTVLSENSYRRLVQIWSLVEHVFKQLLNTLEGELNLLARKFYIRTCEKKRKFELEHKSFSEHKVEQIGARQICFEWLDDLVDCYIEEDNPTLPNLHKAVCGEFSASSFFHGIADVTEKEGSDKGLALLKERFKEYLSMVPDKYIINAAVDYISQIFVHAKEVLKCKLDYIKISAL